MVKVLTIALILSQIALFTEVYFTSESQKERDYYKAECDNLKRQVDSLHAENYPCQIELSRYQTAYEIFLKRNYKAATQYGDIISQETE